MSTYRAWVVESKAADAMDLASPSRRGSRAIRVGNLLPVAGLVASLALGACGATATFSKAGEQVDVLVSLSDAEMDAFEAVLGPFESTSGIRVDVQRTTDLRGELDRRIADGDLPDISGLVGPGHMRSLARAGVLRDLSEAMDLATYSSETPPGFIELGTVDGRVVGAFVKASLKGLIWFNPRTNRLGAPSDWDDLQRSALRGSSAGTVPWCLGLAAGAASGWPGTDWIENMLLRQSGVRAYDEWVEGTLPWTSPEVRSAFTAYGDVVASGMVHGGPAGTLSVPFDDAGDALFTDPPGCLYLQAASFMPAVFRAQGLRAGTDFDFFPFPVIDPRHEGTVEVAGDLVGLLSDGPAARDLVSYLVSADAQGIWVARGGALSANMRVTSYPDDVTRREAAVLTGASRVRFDASDQMPAELNAAFWQGVLDFTRDQGRLDEILAGLEGVRASTGGPA